MTKEKMSVNNAKLFELLKFSFDCRKFVVIKATDAGVYSRTWSWDVVHNAEFVVLKSWN